MIALTVDNISLSFGTKNVLCDVSFSLDESDRLGVIGVNGSGKSTLFKLILGELEAEKGGIYISKFFFSLQWHMFSLVHQNYHHIHNSYTA